SSRDGRRMPYCEIPSYFGWNVSESVIRRIWEERGYHRRLATRKCPISEINRQKRLIWAQNHVHWTEEEWSHVLWSDETWVTPGRHRRTWMTRKPGEELNPNCVVDKVQRKRGWMFWGCFFGENLGQGIFWEKDWGKINASGYQQHVTPVIEGMVKLAKQRFDLDLVLMQDNAPAHNAETTLRDLAARGVTIMDWPPFSPDLNPIETLWNMMKDKIGVVLPENRDVSYDFLRRVVQEAWDTITQDDLRSLMGT